MSFSYFFLTCIVLLFALTPTLFNNPVWSVLAFISVFLSIVCILLNMNIEFLAFVYAIVYIGAVAVLFLFVVMLLRVSAKYYDSFNIYWILVIAIFGCFVSFQIIIVIFRNLYCFNKNIIISYNNIFEINTNGLSALPSSVKRSELYDIAAKFYTIFSSLFMETAFILLVALVAIIVLVLQKPNTIPRNAISVKKPSFNVSNQITYYVAKYWWIMVLFFWYTVNPWFWSYNIWGCFIVVLVVVSILIFTLDFVKIKSDIMRDFAEYNLFLTQYHWFWQKKTSITIGRSIGLLAGIRFCLYLLNYNDIRISFFIYYAILGLICILAVIRIKHVFIAFSMTRDDLSKPTKLLVKTNGVDFDPGLHNAVRGRSV